MDTKQKNGKPGFDEVTPEIIQDWKARFGDAEGCITQVNVPITDTKDGEDGPQARYFLCVPSRTVVDRVAEYGMNKELQQANKLLIANCVLGGDMDILERDGNVYEAVLNEIQKLRKSRVASVKKL